MAYRLLSKPRLAGIAQGRWEVPMIRGALIGCAIALSLVSAAVVANGGEVIRGEVIITSDEITPPTLVTATEHQVRFVNASGHPVHLQFMMPGGNGVQHHLFQVPTSIWAIFHQTGTHPYVVQFNDPLIQDLHGTVEVVASASGGPTHRVCTGITIEGECVER